MFGGEVFGCARVVLGDAKEGYAAGAKALVEAFQERESELADRAGDFEEGSDDRAFFEQLPRSSSVRSEYSFWSSDLRENSGTVSPAARCVMSSCNPIQRESRRKIPIAKL